MAGNWYATRARKAALSCAAEQAAEASRPRIWKGVASGSSILAAPPSPPPPLACAEMGSGRRAERRRGDADGTLRPKGGAWLRGEKEDGEATGAAITSSLFVLFSPDVVLAARAAVWRTGGSCSGTAREPSCACLFWRSFLFKYYYF